MPRKRTQTTKYGAPTVDGGFSVIKMTQLRFNDDSKSFDFEFQLEVEGVLQCFWLTWEEANTFPQYQTCFWFYIRDTITTWHANDVEDFLPSTTIDELMEEELSLIHISEPTRLGMISYAVFCLKKKKK